MISYSQKNTTGWLIPGVVYKMVKHKRKGGVKEVCMGCDRDMVAKSVVRCEACSLEVHGGCVEGFPVYVNEHLGYNAWRCRACVATD